MKSKVIVVLFSVFFVLFLLLGIKTGQSLLGGKASNTADRTWKTTPDNLEIIAQGPPTQTFTLIIYIDDLTIPEPTLQGVWLCRTGEDSAEKYFFPIFPSQAEDGINRDQTLQTAFWLTPDKYPIEAFLAELSRRNLTWQRILIIDRTVLSDIGNLINSMPQQSIFDIPGILSSTTYAPDRRLEVQMDQGRMISELCRHLGGLDQGMLSGLFQEGFAGHLIFHGTSADEFALLWQTESECVFPTLDLTSP